MNSGSSSSADLDPLTLEASSRLDAVDPGVVETRLMSPEVRGHLFAGTAILGFGVMVERGTGFAANVLAYRLGGAGTFGAYSLAITTANNIATYAAAGIGATAARFSGKYRYGTVTYPALARALALVSTISAAVAVLLLYFGAPPLARLLGQPKLTGLLRWAVLSSAGAILLECARGFFVGQRRLRALLTLSLLVGVGLLCWLPLSAARRSPTGMVVSQGSLTVGAVLLCLILAGPLKLKSQLDVNSAVAPLGPMVKEVWGFGFVQLAGLVGTNLSGWWLTTLVARGDTSLIQMGYFAIASQLRNLVGLAPGLLTEGSYAIMADPAGEEARTPQHVLGLTTFASCAISLLLAGVGIVFAPLLLKWFYSDASVRASLTVSVALGLAVVHMGNAPASARLSILSIRTSGWINTLWAATVVIAGTSFMLHGGTAADAMAVYLAAHSISSALVLYSLHRRRALATGLTMTCAVTSGTACFLVVLAALRSTHPDRGVAVSMGMSVLLLASMFALFLIGHHHRWAPSYRTLKSLISEAKVKLRRQPIEVKCV